MCASWGMSRVSKAEIDPSFTKNKISSYDFFSQNIMDPRLMPLKVIDPRSMDASFVFGKFDLFDSRKQTTKTSIKTKLKKFEICTEANFI